MQIQQIPRHVLFRRINQNLEGLFWIIIYKVEFKQKKRKLGKERAALYRGSKHSFHDQPAIVWQWAWTASSSLRKICCCQNCWLITLTVSPKQKPALCVLKLMPCTFLLVSDWLFPIAKLCASGTRLMGAHSENYCHKLSGGSVGTLLWMVFTKLSQGTLSFNPIANCNIHIQCWERAGRTILRWLVPQLNFVLICSHFTLRAFCLCFACSSLSHCATCKGVAMTHQMQRTVPILPSSLPPAELQVKSASQREGQQLRLHTITETTKQVPAFLLCSVS